MLCECSVFELYTRFCVSKHLFRCLNKSALIAIIYTKKKRRSICKQISLKIGPEGGEEGKVIFYSFLKSY